MSASATEGVALRVNVDDSKKKNTNRKNKSGANTMARCEMNVVLFCFVFVAHTYIHRVCDKAMIQHSDRHSFTWFTDDKYTHTRAYMMQMLRRLTACAALQGRR